ncbi:hypothetical protein SLE2022_083130 [Rubroshorea leprosula]
MEIVNVGEEEFARTLIVKEKANPDDEECEGHDQNATFMVVFSTFVAVCGSFVVGTALGYSSPAETGIRDDLGISAAEYSLFASILTIGGMIGAVLSGRVADLAGRKYAMGISEILCIIGWLAESLSKNILWLDLGRFLVGCGIGLLSYMVPVYVAEITSKDVRGSFTSLHQLMTSIGSAVTFIVGSLVSWRTLALIGIMPCLLQLMGLAFIPESPRWLAKTSRMEEFEATLQQLRGRHADISQEAEDIKEYTEYLQRISNDGIRNLFQQKYVYSVIVGVGLMVFQQFGGVKAFSFYATRIFESAGFPSKPGTIAAAVVEIVMASLGVTLIDKSGRRPLLLASSAGTCLGCVFTGLSFFLQDLHSGKELVAFLVLVGVLVFLGSFELAMGGIPWVIMSEIFSINIKVSAGSLATLVSWFGSWIIAYTFTFLFEWSSAGTFFIFAGICAAGTLFIAKLVPETKGRALEEIQNSMTSQEYLN